MQFNFYKINKTNQHIFYFINKYLNVLSYFIIYSFIIIVIINCLIKKNHTILFNLQKNHIFFYRIINIFMWICNNMIIIFCIFIISSSVIAITIIKYHNPKQAMQYEFNLYIKILYSYQFICQNIFKFFIIHFEFVTLV